MSDLWTGIKDVFKGGVNYLIGLAESYANAWVAAANIIIGALNKIQVNIPEWVPLIGGKSFGINLAKMSKVSLPRLAEGGIVTKPTLAMLGESGPEAVIPLNRRGSERVINININNLNGFNARDIANTLQGELNKKITI